MGEKVEMAWPSHHHFPQPLVRNHVGRKMPFQLPLLVLTLAKDVQVECDFASKTEVILKEQLQAAVSGDLQGRVGAFLRD